MKKKILLTLMLCLFVGLAYSQLSSTYTFLATADDVNASATAVNGTGFTSTEVKVRTSNNQGDYILIVVEFTRTTGTAADVDFEFQCSYDNGTTWTTDELIVISCPTNTDDDLLESEGGTVRFPSHEYIRGVSHLRLYRIKNNDGSTNLTSCNAYVIWNR